jgi:phosphinothricin acetyltransferase
MRDYITRILKAIFVSRYHDLLQLEPVSYLCGLVMDAISVRLADNSDISQITNIANHYIQSSVATFRTEMLSESAILKTYLSVRGQGLPYIVACAADSPTVLGYAYASGFLMPRYKAYSHTVEISVYVHPEHRTRGIGSAMMNDLLFKFKSPDSLQGWAFSKAPAVSEVVCVMAVDVTGKDAGFGLRDWYGRWGFEQVGRMKRVGFKFGIWIDTLILQLSLVVNTIRLSHDSCVLIVFNSPILRISRLVSPTIEMLELQTEVATRLGGYAAVLLRDSPPALSLST